MNRRVKEKLMHISPSSLAAVRVCVGYECVYEDGSSCQDDTPGAYTKADLRGPPVLLELPKNFRPREFDRFRKPVVLLVKALMAHKTALMAHKRASIVYKTASMMQKTASTVVHKIASTAPGTAHKTAKMAHNIASAAHKIVSTAHKTAKMASMAHKTAVMAPKTASMAQKVSPMVLMTLTVLKTLKRWKAEAMTALVLQLLTSSMAPKTALMSPKL